MDPQVAVALITASAAVILGFFKLWADIRATHNLVNSRMTELLELTRVSSVAQGRLAGAKLGEVRLEVSGVVNSAEDSAHVAPEEDVGETGLAERGGGGTAI